MVKVTVTKQSNHAVDAKKIKSAVTQIVVANGMVSDCEVSVAIAGEDKVSKLAIRYLGDNEDEAREHPVLSFPTNEIEGTFVFPPGSTLQLGEIIVSYPRVVDEAKAKGKLIDDVACELAQHGALHLMGIHHD